MSNQGLSKVQIRFSGCTRV